MIAKFSRWTLYNLLENIILHNKKEKLLFKQFPHFFCCLIYLTLKYCKNSTVDKVSMEQVIAGSQFLCCIKKNTCLGKETKKNCNGSINIFFTPWARVLSWTWAQTVRFCRFVHCQEAVQLNHCVLLASLSWCINNLILIDQNALMLIGKTS
jgi:hypothetical protein